MTLDSRLIDRQKELISNLRQLLRQYSAETKRTDAVLASSIKQSQDELAAVKARSQKAMVDIASEQQSAVNALAKSNRADLRKISTLKFPRVPLPALGTNPSYSDELEARVSKARRISLGIKDLIPALDKQTERQGELSLTRQALALCVAAIVVTAYMLIRVGAGQASWSLLWWLLFAALLVAIANSRWNLTTNQEGKGFNWLYILGGPISILFALHYAFYTYPKSVKAVSSKKHIGARDAKDLLDEIVRSLRGLFSLRSEAEYIKATWVKQAEAENGKKTASLEAAYQNRLSDLKKAYEKGRDQIYAGCRAIRQESALVGADWPDPLWRSWSASRTRFAPLIRIGLLRERQDRQFATPAFVPIVGGKNLLIKSPRDPQAKTQARLIIKNIVQRLLATCPPGKVRFIFIDPINSGENMAPFMRLKDFNASLVGAKVWTETQDIEKQLQLLTEHIEIVVQRYLSNRHRDIASYNRQAGDVEEPYRVLVIEDFPSRFSDSSIQRLENVIRSGNRCGVCVLLVLDTDEQLPYGSSQAFISELERASTVVEFDGTRFVLRDAVLSESLLVIDNESTAQLLDQILDAVGPMAEDANRIEVPFERIVPLGKDFWEGKSAEGLSMAIGRDLETNTRCDFVIGRKEGIPPNILIAGRVGQGKSNLLHVIVTAMCSLYSPDQVNFYLLDMKQGVEFQKYTKSDIPHMRVMVVSSDREAGLAVLAKVESMFVDRSTKFKAGVGYQHIESYRAATGERLARIVLVIDEYQVLFSESDSIAMEAGRILETLVRQARAYGIHIVLSTQSVSGSGALPRPIMDQMGIRIAMQLSDTESRFVLGDDNPAASLITRVGEAIFNDKNGLVSENRRIQIAWLPPDTQKAYLDKITGKQPRAEYAFDEPKIVFDGNTPADINNCAAIGRLLDRQPAKGIPTRVDFWLGEPIDLEHSALSLERRTGDNLLVIGSNQELAAGLFCVSLASLLLQYPGDSVEVVVIDLMDSASKFTPIIDFFRKSLPGGIEVVDGRSMTSPLSEVGEELDVHYRQEVGEDASSLRHRYIFVLGLQRARVLREANLSSGDDEQDNDTLRLVRILSQGPELGTHLWIWCDTVSSFRERIGSDSLDKFQKRAVLQVSESDSYNVIGTYAASNLGGQRALLYDVQENKLSKVKPFGVPPARWMQRATDRMKGSGIANLQSAQVAAKTAADLASRRGSSPAGVSQPRCPCLLLFDTSRFMKDKSIQSLSGGLRVFKEHVLTDQLASERVSIAVVTFDSEVRRVQDFVTIQDFKPVTLQVQGSSCCIGAGINKALDLIQTQRQQYESSAIAYHRPWIFMITGGRFQGESADVIEAASARIQRQEAGRRLVFFTVGVDDANIDALKGIAVRTPARTVAANFDEMFRWLAASMTLRCHSNPGAPISLPLSPWRTG